MYIVAFISNLDGVLHKPFIFSHHLTELVIWFSDTKAFLCSIRNLCKEKVFPLGSSSDL